ncbi:AAA family ATPase [Bradyrhizobium sp. STM 3809]|uniref:AAA family ATPase n=1 Tax=Bradyrhizobium sp. STM 3809 TaxID=551936 RepID=UPI0007C7CA04|nr:AAA family ATPase [Bradyrhizobium sp. STM 3809]
MIGIETTGPNLSAVADNPDSIRGVLLVVREYLLRHWRLLIATTTLAIGAGIANIALTPPKYASQASIMIGSKKDVWIRSDLTIENLLVDDAAVETEIETTVSEKVIATVVSRLRLDQNPEFECPDRGLFAIFSPSKTSLPPSEARIRCAVSTVASNLSIVRVGRSYIEEITYTSRDPVLAGEVANAIAQAYIEDQLQSYFETSIRTNTWLEKRVAELHKQVQESLQAVQDFKFQNAIILGSQGRLASEVELDKLAKELAKSRAETIQAQAKLEQITHVLVQRSKSQDFDVSSPAVPDALNSPVINGLRDDFLKDKSKEAELSARYGTDHQAAVQLRERMAARQQAIWDEIGRLAEGYKSQVQIAKAHEDELNKKLDEVFQQSAATRQLQAKLRELESTAKVYQSNYATFLARFTQTAQQQPVPANSSRIVHEAGPGFRIAPISSQILMLSALYGLGFGVLASLVRNRTDRGLRTRKEVERVAQKPCLANLPDAGRKRLGLGRRGSKRPEAAFRQIVDAGPFSATAEALRAVKLALELKQEGSKIIGMVSARPGEGKTTTAAGLATFLAKNQHRVLLVDGDLRKQSMTRMLGYAKQSGLIELRAGQVDFEEVIISDLAHGFDFVPASALLRPSSGADILNSPRVSEALKSAKGKYDYVLVDLPPILPVVDVVAAASTFDAFVLVVNWNETRASEVLAALSASPSITDRVVGVILNKVDEAALRRFEGRSKRSSRYYEFA